MILPLALSSLVYARTKNVANCSIYTHTDGVDISNDGSFVIGNIIGHESIAWRIDITNDDQIVNYFTVSEYDDWSMVLANNNDGRISVGCLDGPNRVIACYWTAKEDGKLHVTTLDNLSSSKWSISMDVSNNGKVIVGIHKPHNRKCEAFIWRHSTKEYTGLGYLAGDSFSKATAISGDGHVAVGISGNIMRVCAFIWRDSDNHMLPLGPRNNNWWSEAVCLSDDSSVVVGCTGPIKYKYLPSKLRSDARKYACRWYADTGDLSVLNHSNSAKYSVATCVNGNGSVIAGLAGNKYWHEAVIWEEDRMHRLGTLDGHLWSRANSISHDGSIVIGSSGYAEKSIPFIWTKSAGMRVLHPFLFDDIVK